MFLAPNGTRRRRCARVLVLLALFVPTGCNTDGVGSLHQVSGKVTVNGGPLALGSVRFVPDTAKGNTTPTEPVGEIQPDGTYKLSTNGKLGAPAGWYKVTVTAAEPVDSSRPFSGKVHVAPKFNVPETSGLSVEVVAKPGPGTYDLEVKSR